MSLAYPARTGQVASLAWRQFRKSLWWTSGVVAFGCVAYLSEKYLFQPPKRFVESPTELMIRSFGLTHFIIGWLFMFTSRRLRSPRAVLQLGFLALVGLGCCWAFAAMGGMKSSLAVFAFFALFLVHDLRDDAELTQHYDGAATSSDQQSFRNSLVRCTTLFFVVILGFAYLARGVLIEPERLGGIPAPWLGAAWGGLLAWLVVASTRLVAQGRRDSGSFRAALAAQTPLPQIYMVLFVLLVLGSIAGSVGFHLLILIHASTWIVFVTHRQAAAPHQGRGLWHSVRNTPSGFVTLYLALTLLFVVLLALRVYVWRRAGWVCETLSMSSFPYWSFMHIAMAFWKK